MAQRLLDDCAAIDLRDDIVCPRRLLSLLEHGLAQVLELCGFVGDALEVSPQ